MPELDILVHVSAFVMEMGTQFNTEDESVELLARLSIEMETTSMSIPVHCSRRECFFWTFVCVEVYVPKSMCEKERPGH